MEPERCVFGVFFPHTGQHQPQEHNAAGNMPGQRPAAQNRRAGLHRGARLFVQAAQQLNQRFQQQDVIADKRAPPQVAVVHTAACLGQADALGQRDGKQKQAELIGVSAAPLPEQQQNHRTHEHQ